MRGGGRRRARACARVVGALDVAASGRVALRKALARRRVGDRVGRPLNVALLPYPLCAECGLPGLPEERDHVFHRASSRSMRFLVPHAPSPFPFLPPRQFLSSEPLRGVVCVFGPVVDVGNDLDAFVVLPQSVHADLAVVVADGVLGRDGVVQRHGSLVVARVAVPPDAHDRADRARAAHRQLRAGMPRQRRRAHPLHEAVWTPGKNRSRGREGGGSRGSGRRSGEGERGRGRGASRRRRRRGRRRVGAPLSRSAGGLARRRRRNPCPGPCPCPCIFPDSCSAQHAPGPAELEAGPAASAATLEVDGGGGGGGTRAARALHVAARRARTKLPGSRGIAHGLGETREPLAARAGARRRPHLAVGRPLPLGGLGGAVPNAARSIHPPPRRTVQRKVDRQNQTRRRRGESGRRSGRRGRSGRRCEGERRDRLPLLIPFLFFFSPLLPLRFLPPFFLLHAPSSGSSFLFALLFFLPSPPFHVFLLASVSSFGVCGPLRSLCESFAFAPLLFPGSRRDFPADREVGRVEDLGRPEDPSDGIWRPDDLADHGRVREEPRDADAGLGLGRDGRVAAQQTSDRHRRIPAPGLEAVEVPLDLLLTRGTTHAGHKLPQRNKRTQHGRVCRRLARKRSDARHPPPRPRPRRSVPTLARPRRPGQQTPSQPTKHRRLVRANRRR